MKEAAGEANMTVITIVLIAIVLGVGTIIVNNMMRSSGQSSACSNAGGIWQGGRCYDASTCSTDADGSANCGTGATQLTCTQGNDGTWNCARP